MLETGKTTLPRDHPPLKAVGRLLFCPRLELLFPKNRDQGQGRLGGPRRSISGSFSVDFKLFTQVV